MRTAESSSGGLQEFNERCRLLHYGVVAQELNNSGPEANAWLVMSRLPEPKCVLAAAELFGDLVLKEPQVYPSLPDVLADRLRLVGIALGTRSLSSQVDMHKWVRNPEAAVISRTPNHDRQQAATASSPFDTLPLA